MSKDFENITMVDLHKQYLRICEQVDQAFEQIMESTAFINGPQVHEFAKNLATYLEVEHVIPCGNGTDALQIALMSLGLEPGDEVITTPFTFIATAEVIALLGLKPVFVDALPDTFNIDHTAIEAAITDRTRCIIPVHLFGQSAHMEPIVELAQQHELYIVEDNAQAIGADYTFSNGITLKTGAIGHMGCTSFYPTKNLGCYGDGGAINSNDAALAAEVRMMANHGSKVRYHHETIGVNSRLDSFQAAVLNAKLPLLDTFCKERQDAAARYDSLLNDTEDIVLPYRAPYSTHVFHQYTLRIKNGRREALKAHLKAKNIAYSIYYPIPLHLQNAYRSYGYSEGDFPISEQLSEEVISLPMHTELKADVQAYIAEEVKAGIK